MYSSQPSSGWILILRRLALIPWGNLLKVEREAPLGLTIFKDKTCSCCGECTPSRRHCRGKRRQYTHGVQMLPCRDPVTSLTNFEDGAGLSVGNSHKPISRDFRTCGTCSDKFPFVMGLPENAVYLGWYEVVARAYSLTGQQPQPSNIESLT